jgi:uncharacterized membrane protein
MKTWQKIGFAIAALLAIASWVIAIYYWGKLPSVIPTHFGVNGTPDAWSSKSIWYVFLIPSLQTVLLAAFIFLFYKPQYSDMPTTLWLMAMKSETKEHAFDLIRTMIVGISIWIGVLFTYITYGMNTSALLKDSGLNPWITLGIVGAMIIWLIWWTVKVYKSTKEAIKKGVKNE